MSAISSNPTGSPVRYSRPAIILHWLVFFVVALGLYAIEFRGPRGSEMRGFWTGIHIWCGVTVLTLTIVRLAYRLVHGAPAPEAGGGFLATCARALHLLFYVALIAQPLLGILMINMGGDDVTLMGTHWSITLVDENDDLSKVMKTAHVWLGNSLFYLIGLHALAALWHQYIRRDGTLKRML
jgi:cytochrome b561